MGRVNEEEASRKHLKIFVGNLPPGAGEAQLGQHFARHGQVMHVNLPRTGEEKHYGFVTFKCAADADCSVVDPQPFPGSARPLVVKFANSKRGEESKPALSDGDPCKVFIGGVGERDSEEEIGDFFSQWGLVALVYRDRSWGFVHFATPEGARRLLEEGGVFFQRRRIDVKASDSRRGPMEAGEKDELVRRAVARHFHKKSLAAYPVSHYPGYPGHPGGHPGYAYPGYAPSYPPAFAPGHGAGHPYAGGYYPGEPPKALTSHEYRPDGFNGHVDPRYRDARGGDGREMDRRHDDRHRERRDDRGQSAYSASADPYYRSAGPPPSMSPSTGHYSGPQPCSHPDPYARPAGSRYQAY